MSNLTNTFVGLITTGVTAMNAISDPKEKALVAAELAKAVAATGLVGLSGEAASTIEEQTIAPAEAAEVKEAIENKKPGKLKKPVVKEEPVQEAAEPPAEETTEEPPAEEPAPTETEQVDDPTEPEDWTEENIALYEVELGYITSVREAYGDDGIEASISTWSDGVYTTFDDISPSNVQGFAKYLEGLIADLEAQEA